MKTFESIPWFFYAMWICIPVSTIFIPSEKTKMPKENAKMIGIIATATVSICSLAIFICSEITTNKFGRQFFENYLSFGSADGFTKIILLIFELFLIFLIIILPIITFSWSKSLCENNDVNLDN